MLTSLSILDPKIVNNYGGLNVYEYLSAYQRRIRKFLHFERFVRDPLTLEERAMCKLLIMFTARVLENGSIDLHHLGEYLDKCGVPPY